MTSPRSLLTAHRLRPHRQLGQNFLSQPSVAEMIVARAGVSPEEVVLEIGAGLGALTIPLARAARGVTAIERDRNLVPLLRAELLAAGIQNVTIIETDALALDLPELARGAGRPLTVFGNLPYNISSQIVIKLIESRRQISRAVLMFQKELAQRLSAGPGGRDYGRITAMLTYCASVQASGRRERPQLFPAAESGLGGSRNLLYGPPAVSASRRGAPVPPDHGRLRQAPEDPEKRPVRIGS